MKKLFKQTDIFVISICRRLYPFAARLAIFIVYFWFGLLKVIGHSPAGPLVAELLNKTLPFFTAEQFIFWFGLLEMLIGILFLFPKLTRYVVVILILHLITTAGPLVLLPQITWSGFLIPTLEGQYIIKNVLIMAAVLGIVANIDPWKELEKDRLTKEKDFLLNQ